MARLVALLLLLPASASAFSLLGAKPLAVKEFGLHVEFGYPDVSVRFVQPIVTTFQVEPRLTFYYAPAIAGGSIRPGPGAVGNTFGVRLKWMVYDKGGLHVAVDWEPSLWLGYTPSFNVGASFGAPGGVIVDYTFDNGMTVLGGFHFPFTVLMFPSVDAALPFVFSAGFEMPLTAKMNLSLSFDGGPVPVIKDGKLNRVGAVLVGRVGLGWVF